MDVPFGSSGASTRQHYALARKVENAVDHRDARKALVDEVSEIQKKLSSTRVSTKNCKELLVVLLYCLHASMDGTVTSASLYFALPYAVNLAEAGQKVSEKRIGYLFCREVMPPHHELQLMLVNTIYKDLRSTHVSRIALALETIISSPSADIIPAVQIQLQDLMAHPSHAIRALTIDAIRTLSTMDPAIRRSKHVKSVLLQRLEDGNEAVQRAAFRLSIELIKDGSMKTPLVYAKCITFLRNWASRKNLKRRISSPFPAALDQTVLRTLTCLIDMQALSSIHDPASMIAGILIVLHHAVEASFTGVVLECFRVLSRIPEQDIIRWLRSTSPDPDLPEADGDPLLLNEHARIHPLHTIRPYLSSRLYADHYLFLSCLDLLPVSLWGGSPVDPETKSAATSEQALEQWEVEKIMTFLDSDDYLTRRLTLRLLIRVDRSIVEQYFRQLLDHFSTGLSSGRGHDPIASIVVRRLLDAAAELASPDQDGDAYGSKLVEVLEHFQKNTSAREFSTPLVLPELLEAVLTQARSAVDAFQCSLISRLLKSFHAEQPALLDPIDEPPEQKLCIFGGTHVLVFAALACEHAHLLAPDTAASALQTLSLLLEHCPNQLVEPILLSMTRIRLFMPNDITSDSVVWDRVTACKSTNDGKRQSSSKSIVKRCDQFFQLQKQRSILHAGLRLEQPQPLPDFATALDQHANVEGDVTSVKSPRLEAVSPAQDAQRPSPKLSESKLRYEAYETPKPTPRLRRGNQAPLEGFGRPINPRSSSDQTADRKVLNGVRKAFLSENGSATEHATTSGELIEMDPVSPSRPRPRPELISLDSPFLALGDENVQAELQPSIMESIQMTMPLENSRVTSTRESSSERTVAFDELWNAIKEHNSSARGWCDTPVEDLVWRLQSMNTQMTVFPADVPPFIGELKIVMHPLHSVAASETDASPWREPSSDDSPVDPPPSQLPSAGDFAIIRLREGEDSSCLWQVRCKDDDHRAAIVHIFQEDTQ